MIKSKTMPNHLILLVLLLILLLLIRCIQRVFKSRKFRVAVCCLLRLIRIKRRLGRVSQMGKARILTVGALEEHKAKSVALWANSYELAVIIRGPAAPTNTAKLARTGTVEAPPPAPINQGTVGCTMCMINQIVIVLGIMVLLIDSSRGPPLFEGPVLSRRRFFGHDERCDDDDDDDGF
jgi:hypothetical protein